MPDRARPRRADRAPVDVEAVLAALTAPMDRGELGDVVRVETLRRAIVEDPTPVHFEVDRRSGDDQPFLPEVLGRAQDETLGAWVARSAIQPAYGRVLHRLARLTGGPVAEVGTGSGLSAAYLACGAAASATASAASGAGPAVLVTIEPHAVLARRARGRLDELGVAGVHVVNATQEDYLGVLLGRLRPRLVHIDSDHTVAPMTRMLEQVLATPDPLVLALDDIRWSAGMERLWGDLGGAVRAVAGLIDLGLWGVVVVDPAHVGPPATVRAVAPAYVSGAVLLDDVSG